MDRKTFAYKGGDGNDVHADPIAAHRRFVQALEGDPGPVLEAAQQKKGADGRESPADLLDRLEAEGKLADASRAAFGLPPFDPATGGGFGDGPALDVLYAFLEYLEGNAGGAGSSQTSAPSTAPPS